MRGRIDGLILGALLMLAAAPAWAMPQALIYVGSIMLGSATTAVVVAGVILIVAGYAWGNAEQRKAESDRLNAERDAYNASLKTRMATVISGDSPYVYVYGKDVAVGCQVLDVYTSGNRDQYHHIVAKLADHESAAIYDVAINDKWLGTLDADGNVTTGDFYDTYQEHAFEVHTGTVFNLAHEPVSGTLHITHMISGSDGGTEMTMPYTIIGTEVTVAADHNFSCTYQWTRGVPRVRVTKRLGAAGAGSDARLLAECPGEYLSTSVWEGKTLLIIRVDLDCYELAGGNPSIKARIDGKLLHDVRDPSWPNDTPVCSENNALCIADFLTSEMVGAPYTDLPQADYIAAANVCDQELVVDGQTVKRYTLRGTVRSDEDASKVLEDMANSMAGSIVGTTWSIHAGAWEAPVMVLSQEDIAGNFSWVPGSTDGNLFNGVRGQFISEQNQFVPTDFTPYQNATYVAADGEEKWADISFPFTAEAWRVHNICRIKTEDQRNSFTLKVELKWKAWSLEIGQRATFDFPFLGQVGKVYRVMNCVRGMKQPIEVTLKEDDPTFYDEADAIVVDSTPNTNLPNPWRIAPIASITCSSGTDVLQVGSDGSIISRILVQWPQSTTQGVVHGGYIELEWCRFGAAWQSTQVTGDATSAYISPVKDSVWYQVRLRCVNPLLNVKSNWTYRTHWVIGKTARPSAVTSITAQGAALNVLLAWEEIADADRLDYLIADDTGGVLTWVAYPGNEAKLPPGSAGLHTYRIVARDTSKLTALTEATCQLTINAPGAAVVSSAFLDGMVILSWNDCTTTHQLKNYEVRYGADWDTGTFVARTDARGLRITPDWTGTRTFWVAGVDIAANVGAAGSVPVEIAVPEAPALTAAFVGENLKLSWTKPSSTLPVDMYELRYGATWAGGTSLGKFKVTSHTLKAEWTGARLFWVAAIDIAGNTGTPAQIGVTVNAAPAPTITIQVIDNNAILRWTAVQGTLPTKTYEIRRGATFSGATVLGTKNGTFDIAPETSSGTYTYWVVQKDSADNYGAPGSAVATVAQPPDYILRSDLNSAFGGTLSNLALHGDGSWIGPVNTTETFAEHFTNNSWATPQDQIDAGYPIYIQPNAGAAYYEEVVDYGVVLAGTRITVTINAIDVVGAVARSCKISVSEDGVSYTDYDGVWQVYAAAFRYVKYRVTFTASNSTDLIEIEQLNFRLDVKHKTISLAIAFNAVDAAGTEIYLTDDGTATGNKLFIDVESIVFQPYGTTRIDGVVDFTDAPYPLSCKVLAWDAAGTRVSGNGSLTVGGS